MAEKRRKKSIVGKVLLLVLLVLLLVVAALTLFLFSKLDKIQYADKVGTPTEPAYTENIGETTATEVIEEIVDISGLEQVEIAPTVPDSEIFVDSNVFNILLIGTDYAVDQSDRGRSDAMILMSIDKKNNTVKLVSLERGVGVPILEGKYEGQYDWLTHIHSYGGADLLVKTVRHCFKVDVEHYVRVDFDSFRKVVDAVGGVDIELSDREAGALNTTVYQTTGRNPALREGTNHLDGYAALHFARLRRIDSDWTRITRQRKVILAVVDALKGASLLELNDLADTVLPLVHTNLSQLQIAELLLYAPNFLKSTFDQMTIPKQGTYGGMRCMGGRGAFAVDYEINNDLLHRFFYEGATSEELLAE